MKINLTRLLYSYHKLSYGLIYFSVKYLNVGNIFLTITIFSYLLSSTLFIFSVFNSLNIMFTSPETISLLEQYDFPLELIETNFKKDKGDSSMLNNIISKFFELFKTNGASSALNISPEELRNQYYMQNKCANIMYESREDFTGIKGSLQTGVDKFNADPPSNCESRPLKSEGIDSLTVDKYSYKSSAYNQEVLVNVQMLSEILKDLKVINENISNSVYNNE